MKSIYLDHNATTPMSPAATEAMAGLLASTFGNPSSEHRLGLAARGPLETARERVAALIGAAPSEVVFTAGGTEANVTALRSMALGARQRQPDRMPHLVTAATEHPSVLGTLEQLEGLGLCRVTVLTVDPLGHVNLDALELALGDADGLSLMWANNETGTLAHLSAIADRVRHAGVPWHCDGVQAVGKVPVDLEAGPAGQITTLAVASHKFHGPKGVGALYVRRGAPMIPLMPGDGAEAGRRAGTPNVAGIAAMGVAAREAAARNAQGEGERLEGLRDRLESRLLGALPGSAVHGDRDRRLPNTLCLSVRGPDGSWADGEELVLGLSVEGVEASTGAACTSGSGDPSHVLLAMGCSAEEAHASLRLSLGSGTREGDVDAAAAAVSLVAGSLQ